MATREQMPAVARRDTGALAFRRQAITGHPDARDVEETDLSTAKWNGVMTAFDPKADIVAHP